MLIFSAFYQLLRGLLVPRLALVTGQREETLAWLERGFEQRDPKMVILKVEPKWNNLRADPRFQDLLKRVGF